MGSDPADGSAGRGDRTLRSVLADAKARGFLGPPPVEAHVAHARAYAPWLADRWRVVDLGSGGGVPGLVLAVALPERTWVLVEASQRRAAFLVGAVERLGLGRSVTVLAARAEAVARQLAWRGWADAVLSRSFGPPAVTAECAAPLLRVGGLLVVSEPPDADGTVRWPAAGLEELGLRLRAIDAGPPRLALLEQVALAAERWPRRVGQPAKRPLW